MPRNNNPGMRRKKAANGNSNNGTSNNLATQDHEHADANHSSISPSCRALATIASDMFGTSSTTASASSSQETSSSVAGGENKAATAPFLATAFKQRLLLQRQDAIHKASAAASAGTGTGTAAAKKKRKKKKKKKATTAATASEAPAATATGDAASGEVKAVLDTTSTAQLSKEDAKSDESVAAASAATATTTTSAAPPSLGQQQASQESLTEPSQPTPTPPAPPVLPVPVPPLSALDLYLNRLLAARSATDTPLNDDALRSFWPVLQAKLVSADNPNSNNNTAASSSSLLLHAPQKAVQVAVAAIQCLKCRERVRDILEVQSTVPVKHQSRREYLVANNLAFSPAALAANVNDNDDDDDDDDDDIERAFDYIAMEEGQAGIGGVGQKDDDTDNNGLVFQFVATEGQQAGWLLRRPNGQAALGSLDDVDTLIKDHVLLPGLSPDQIMGVDSSALSDNVMSSIKLSVDSLCVNQLDEFRQLADKMHQLVAKFQTTNNHDASNIDITSFPTMKDVDEACCVTVMGELLRIVFRVTTVYQGMAASLANQSVPLPGGDSSGNGVSTKGNWAFRGIMEMWKVYLSAVDEINAKILQYEDQLFDLAVRGTITGMFLSSTARGLYRNLVSEKIGIVVSAMQGVQGRLDQLVPVNCVGEEDWVTPFIRKLFTYEACYKAGGSAECTRHHKTLPFDDALGDILYTMREWTETVHNGNVEKILEIHEERRDKLSRLVGTLMRAAKAACDSEEASDEFKGRLKSQPLPQQLAEAEGSVESFKELRKNLAAPTVQLLSVWLSFRLPAFTNQIDASVRETVPYRLRGWLSGAPGFEKVDGDEHVCPCVGGKDSNRAVSILVTLFYRWMSDRCKEWQAEVAESELLVAMENDLGNVVEFPATKSKKAKKKKDKKDRPVENKEPGDGADTNGTAASPVGNVPSLVVDERGPIPIVEPTESAEVADQALASMVPIASTGESAETEQALASSTDQRTGSEEKPSLYWEQQPPVPEDWKTPASARTGKKSPKPSPPVQSKPLEKVVKAKPTKPKASAGTASSGNAKSAVPSVTPAVSVGQEKAPAKTGKKSPKPSASAQSKPLGPAAKGKPKANAGTTNSGTGKATSANAVGSVGQGKAHAKTGKKTQKAATSKQSTPLEKAAKTKASADAASSVKTESASTAPESVVQGKAPVRTGKKAPKASVSKQSEPPLEKVTEPKPQGKAGAGVSSRVKTAPSLSSEHESVGRENATPKISEKKGKAATRKEKLKNGKVLEPEVKSDDLSAWFENVDADVNAGVYHKSSFESAEDFLMKRFLAVNSPKTAK